MKSIDKKVCVLYNTFQEDDHAAGNVSEKEICPMSVITVKIDDELKKNVKLTKEKIPAVTQLYTPDWIVRYMEENSLGR